MITKKEKEVKLKAKQRKMELSKKEYKTPLEWEEYHLLKHKKWRT